MKKSLLFVFTCYFSHLIANQEPAHNQTEYLIEYIQQEDQSLKKAQKFYDYFNQNHTYKTSYTVGNTRYTHTYIKPYTSYDIINKYYDAKNVINNFENNATQEVKRYANFVNGIDEFGKTPLEYAQTSQMYDILRSHGAHFQLHPYIKIYPLSSAALFSTALLATIYILYTYNPLSLLHTDTSMQAIPDIDTSNLEEQLSKKEIDLAIQDKFGRTFLMNYLIQQNLELETLNQKIAKLPQKSLELYQMQYTKANILITTEKNIKTMIEQDASIKIYDSFNKNCLSYCTIKELRHLFEKSNNMHSEKENNLIVAISMFGFYASIIGSILVIARP